MRVQALIDRFEIIDVLNEYCHACDRLDSERLADVYWPDSWDDHGHFKCPGPEFARLCSASISTALMCSHQLGQSTVHVEGDKAGTETYFTAILRRVVDGQEFIDQMGGRYVDELERRNGVWKIKNRICIREWSMRVPLKEDWAAPNFVAGLRSHQDPSYRVLGLVQREEHTQKPGTYFSMALAKLMSFL